MSRSIIYHRPSRRAKRCYACSASAKVQCDYPKDPPPGLTPEDLADLPLDMSGRVTTCSRHCCGAHGCFWRGNKHLCREHAQELGEWV